MQITLWDDRPRSTAFDNWATGAFPHPFLHIEQAQPGRRQKLVGTIFFYLNKKTDKKNVVSFRFEQTLVLFFLFLVYVLSQQNRTCLLYLSRHRTTSYGLRRVGICGQFPLQCPNAPTQQ